MVSLEEQPLVNSFNKVFLGAAGTSTGAPDDQFNRVSFLSHFDGANNGVNNAFDDGSASNHTITAAGNVTQGSFGPFARPDGEWGWNFDGSGDHFTVADSTDFDCGTGDFCLELFIFSGGASSNPLLVTFGGGFYLQLKDSMTDISFHTGSTEIIYSGSASLTNNAWHHIAITREGSSLRHFLDGSLVKTTSNSDAVNSSSTVYVGTNTNGSSLAWTGLISNLRLVNGSAVYTSAFTVPTSKLTAITNTKLLTCQSNRFLDNSASAHTVTPSGNAEVTSFGPFLPSSVYSAGINGASSSPLDTVNYLSIADGSWKTLGTGDFTWEFWFYGQTESTYMIGDATASTNVSGTFTLGVSSNRIILYYSIQGGEAYPLQSPDSAPYYNLNEWHHVAYVRDGNDHKIYADGILRASETRSGTMVDSTGAQHIGNFGAGYASGSNTIFSDVRLVKGTAVYSGSTYTVPTAPLTAISNTELLLNFKDAQAIDSAAQNNLTLYGNANTSTDQVKFGNAALHLDGTGDFAKTELSTAFGTGDFTIECFYYNSASFASANRYLFDFGSNGLRIQFFNGTIYYIVGSSTITTTAAGVTHNNWYHLAAVRYNGQMNLYIDGVSRGTQNSVTDNLTERSLTIGDYGGGSQALLGFIDEFRISNFARYTSNFTAPAEPFADKGQ